MSKMEKQLINDHIHIYCQLLISIAANFSSGTVLRGSTRPLGDPLVLVFVYMYVLVLECI